MIEFETGRNIVILTVLIKLAGILIILYLIKTVKTRKERPLFFSEHIWTFNDALKVLMPIILPNVLHQVAVDFFPSIRIINLWITVLIVPIAIIFLFKKFILDKYNLSLRIFGFTVEKLKSKTTIGLVILFLILIALSPQDIQKIQTSGKVRWLITIFALTFPFFEELLFRGVLFPVVQERVGTFMGIIITSFIWSAMHFHYNFHQTAGLFLIGCVLGYSYFKTKTLITPILIH
ncbi:MAG: CPBP family intramembrane metalloprotease, partial [Nitrospirae bacterium]|nr:CPBP family intramembrane metalloprotease [Nitrospirota bacterium]